MEAVKIEATKPGEFIRRKPDAKTTFKRGAYDRGSKSYSAQDCDDINREIFIKRGTIVYVGFTY